MVGDEVQDQAHTTRRKRLPSAGERASSTKMIIDNIAADAVGRSHNIVGLPIGKSASKLTRRSSLVSAIPMPAGLRQLPSARRRRIQDRQSHPSSGRERPKINSPAFGLTDCFQPGPGVDLVEIGFSEF